MSKIKNIVSQLNGSQGNNPTDEGDMPNNLAPFSAFGFKVVLSTLDGEQMGLFQEVSGLSVQVNITDLVEGGVNDRTHKIIGNTTYSNIILKRGLFNRKFFDWITSISKQGKITRDTLKIEILGDDMNAVMAYKCDRVVPVKWNGPTLNVMSDAIATESLELAHEGIEIVDQ